MARHSTPHRKASLGRVRATRLGPTLAKFMSCGKEKPSTMADIEG